VVNVCGALSRVKITSFVEALQLPVATALKVRPLFYINNLKKNIILKTLGITVYGKRSFFSKESDT